MRPSAMALTSDTKDDTMYLKNVYIRFYKSFNFDYLRKFNPNVTDRYPWEKLDDKWYPYVQVPIDETITTVVGENESGKTHLLSAIEKGITGKEIEREDFCRYSQFFAVEQGKMKWPDFGFEWAGVTKQERQALVSAAGIEKAPAFDRFHLFRTQRDRLTLYLPGPAGLVTHEVPASSSKAVVDILPHVFHMKADVALPESVPIRWLIGASSQEDSLEGLARKQRVGLFEKFFANTGWFATKESVTQAAGEIATTMSSFTAGGTDRGSSEERQAELVLARDLILKVAKIDAEAIKELFEALKNGRDAFANSIIDKINDALDSSLNFPHWWVQDSAFQLRVSAREYDLVFTIRDKTGTDYSFAERSSGLRFFLSYYIQYLSHEPREAGREILIMDEPDAYLSSQGQQDLLKIFDAFASPESERLPVQVVYVTHSPFLIDKNHAERIRVLEKGVGDEGTRVVRDASRNHYEPLRSAFGAFVGETTFIGNCNLMTEGPADQILLAGATTYLRSGTASHLETLDLNHLTIVPASGATHVPYLVYLARGRDIEKPAVIVLLDSDDEGNKAKKDICRGGPRNKQILNPAYILQVGDLSSAEDGVATATGQAPIETEDLIPLSICVEATKEYMADVCGAEDEVVAEVTEDAIKAHFSDGVPVFKAIQKYLGSLSSGFHIEKIGFARAVNATITRLHAEKEAKGEPHSEVATFGQNMKVLFRRLAQMQRDALRELASERVSQRLDRAKRSFVQDHPESAKRENAFVLFEEITAALDDTSESDHIRLEMQSLRRDFRIDDDLTAAIDDYPKFLERLQGLKYAARLATQEATETSDALQSDEIAPAAVDGATTLVEATAPSATENQEEMSQAAPSASEIQEETSEVEAAPATAAGQQATKTPPA